MANRRMLHRNVSVNEQLADCSLLARLLYTWGLPHTSDWGVLAGSPRRLKAQIFPVSEESPEEIAGAAQELVTAGLWVPFTDNGSDYVCYPTFDKYQDVHNRTAKPRDGLPVPPTSSVLPANTVKPGKTPPKGREGKGTQEKGGEGNSRERDGTSEPSWSEEYPYLAGNFPVTEAALNTICSHWRANERKKWFVEAVQEAQGAAAREVGLADSSLAEQIAAVKPTKAQHGDWYVGEFIKQTQRGDGKSATSPALAEFIRLVGYDNREDSVWLDRFKAWQKDPDTPEVLAYLAEGQRRQEQKAKRLEAKG